MFRLGQYKLDIALCHRLAQIVDEQGADDEVMPRHSLVNELAQWFPLAGGRVEVAKSDDTNRYGGFFVGASGGNGAADEGNADCDQ